MTPCYRFRMERRIQLFDSGKRKNGVAGYGGRAFLPELLEKLKDTKKIDFIVSHHAEQDHSDSIATLLKKYPMAKEVCTPKRLTYWRN